MADSPSYILRSKRLGFRQWRPTDASLAFALWGRPEVMRLIDARGALTPAQAEERLAAEIESQRTTGVQYWPVFRLSDGAFVGCCGLRPVPGHPGDRELGFHIVPEMWGRGYATEAAGCVIAHARTMSDVRSLVAGHHPDNAASRHILLALGFRQTGTELYPPTATMHPTYLLELR